MKTQRLLPLLMGLALVGSVYAGQTLSAKSVVDGAVRSAKIGHKGVLVVFHASWCGWCKELDKSFEVPALKKVLDKDFVIVHITVLENPQHKSDENPGGAEMMKAMGGQEAGLPFFVMLNSKGQAVSDSMVMGPGNPKPQNMGFPTEPNELEHFVAMLKAGNPGISAAQVAAVQKVMSDRAAEIKAKQGH